VIVFRKFLIVLTTVIFSVVSPEAQVLASLLVVVLAIVLHVKMQPYYTSTLNRMEHFSLLVVIVTMYSGMYYITGVHYTYMENNFLKWFFLLALAIPNVIFFVYWLYHMRIQILRMALRKSEKLFKMITCGSIDPEKFKRDNEEEEEEVEDWKTDDHIG